MGAGCEGFLTDKLAIQDSNLAAEVWIPCVENFYLCSTVDQEKLLGGYEKRNSKIVVGRFTIVHFGKNFLSNREQHIISPRVVADLCDPADPVGSRRCSGLFLLMDNGPGRPSRRRRNCFDSGNEAIAAARKCLHVARLLVRITKSATQRLDSGVHAVLKIDEGISRPKALLQLLAGEQLARLFKQQGEDLKGAAGQTNLAAMLAEFACAEVNVIGAEAQLGRNGERVAHG